MPQDAEKPIAVAAQAARGQTTRVIPAAPEAYLSDLDTQLMLQVAGGDRDAASNLIRRNFERVSRYVARVVRDPRVVEDLTQDVFVKVLAGSKRYTAAAKFSTWLYEIATNVALNYIRDVAAARESSIDPHVALERTVDAGGSPEQRLGLDELRLRISAAVGSLPPNQRVALVLCEQEGLSYEQIAMVMGVTIDAVRALLLRARSCMRELLRGVVK